MGGHCGLIRQPKPIIDRQRVELNAGSTRQRSLILQYSYVRQAVLWRTENEDPCRRHLAAAIRRQVDDHLDPV